MKTNKGKGKKVKNMALTMRKDQPQLDPDLEEAKKLTKILNQEVRAAGISQDEFQKMVNKAVRDYRAENKDSR